MVNLVIKMAAPFTAKMRPKPMRNRAPVNMPTLLETVWRTVATTYHNSQTVSDLLFSERVINGGRTVILAPNMIEGGNQCHRKGRRRTAIL